MHGIRVVALVPVFLFYKWTNTGPFALMLQACMPSHIKNDNENTIGKNIRRLRKEKGLGQTDLVKELQLLDIGMTRETLVKIERGIQHIQLAQLKGIKQILDVSYEDLLD